jgi:hypothetical protein
MAGNDGKTMYGTKLAYAHSTLSFVNKLGVKSQHPQLEVITAMKITLIF